MHKITVFLWLCGCLATVVNVRSEWPETIEPGTVLRITHSQMGPTLRDSVVKKPPICEARRANPVVRHHAARQRLVLSAEWTSEPVLLRFFLCVILFDGQALGMG